MLIKFGDASDLKIGYKVKKYLLPSDGMFDIGEVTVIECGTVCIDFGDSLRRFLATEISQVIDARTAEESYMTVEQGTLVEEYKPALDNLSADLTNIDMFSDLLGKLDNEVEKPR